MAKGVGLSDAGAIIGRVRQLLQSVRLQIKKRRQIVLKICLTLVRCSDGIQRLRSACGTISQIMKIFSSAFKAIKKKHRRF